MSVTPAPLNIAYALERLTPSAPTPPYHDRGERRSEDDLRAAVARLAERQLTPPDFKEGLRDTTREFSDLQRDAYASGFVVVVSLDGQDPHPVPILS